jgi:hypothetical protein
MDDAQTKIMGLVTYILGVYYTLKGIICFLVCITCPNMYDKTQKTCEGNIKTHLG